MLGRKELANLDQQKQALLAESELNRIALQADVQSLRSATAWVNEVTSASRQLAPLLAFWPRSRASSWRGAPAAQIPGSAG